METVCFFLRCKMTVFIYFYLCLYLKAFPCWLSSDICYFYTQLQSRLPDAITRISYCSFKLTSPLSPNRLWGGFGSCWPLMTWIETCVILLPGTGSALLGSNGLESSKEKNYWFSVIFIVDSAHKKWNKIV